MSDASRPIAATGDRSAPPPGPTREARPLKTKADGDASRARRPRRAPTPGEARLAELAAALQRRAPLSRGAGRQGAPTAPTPANAEDLARIACDQSADVAVAYLVALRDQGVAMDTLLCDLLTPAARRLGTLWEEDRRDFIEVTLGMTRLQQAFHRLRPQAPLSELTNGSRPRALIAPTPGETHVFGAAMAAARFENAGWDAQGGAAMTVREILDRLGAERFDLLGLSLACDSLAPAAAELIGRARAASKNPGLRIMLGGRVVDAAPERARALGADAHAVDPVAIPPSDRRAAA